MNPLTLKQSPGGAKRILYMTDKFGISDGYSAAFTSMIARAGIRRNQIYEANIYTLIPNPLTKKANEKTWRFDPAKLGQIHQAFKQKVDAIQPDLIVVSDPALLGIFTNGDSKLATLDKQRGCRYNFQGIPVVITYPITAINTHVDESLLKDRDGDDIEYEPYRSKRGDWILNRDWEKIGRLLHGLDLKLPPFEYSVCRTLDDCLVAEKWLADCVLISTDIETGGWPAFITCIGFTGLKKNGACRSFVIPFAHPFKDGGCFWDDIVDHEIAHGIMCRILANPVPKTMQNGFYDSSYFIKYASPINGWFWDLMLLWYSAYMELPKTLDFIASIVIDDYQYWKDDIKGIEDEKLNGNESIETYWRYNAKDCYYTLFGTLRMIAVLQDSPTMIYNYQDTFTRMLSGLNMSMRGLRANLKTRREIGVELEAERDKALARFKYIIADDDFNINSPQQKASLLYDVLGARERNAKGRYVSNRKGDNRSAGKIPLKMVKSEHPFFEFIIESMEAAMEPDKQISNVMSIYCPDGEYETHRRFFTSFGAAATETTRFNSKKSNFWVGGNIQNIRKKYRRWLQADPGCILMDVDYSQSDDVFMGYEANDANKIAVIESGMDGHAVHGELFFKRPYDLIVAGKKAHEDWVIHPITGVRSISKRVVHGTNFMMAALTLYMTMGRESVVAAATYLGYQNANTMSQEELVNVCGSMMNAYRKKYPRLSKREYYMDIFKMLRDKQKITNAFGVTRRFLGDYRDNGTQREAAGFIGQSATAGNMNRVQREIDWGVIPKMFRDGPNPDFGDTPRMMNWQSHGFEFLAQIHDSFVVQFNLQHPRWKEAADNLLYVMNRPIIINGHSVRIKTEAELGFAWGDKMVSWDSKHVSDLDRIVSGLLERN